MRRNWDVAWGWVSRFGPEGAAGGSEAAAWLPVAGALMGLTLGVLAHFCLWLGGPRAGTVLAALAVLALEWWLTSGRRVRALAALLEAAGRGSATVVEDAYLCMAVFQGLMLLKLLAVAVLSATGRGVWLMVAHGVAATVLGDGLRRGGEGGSSASSGGVLAPWVSGLLVVALGGWLSGLALAALLALAGGWCAAAVLGRFGVRPDSRGGPWGGVVLEGVVEAVVFLGALVVFAGSGGGC
ncbi:MAG: hypothetical protein JXR77_09285 [Lentisphaeria bacterium]|nr:hypothetical protein [Lentisphaeria bacterium]